jgi:hypothetical protein
MIKAIKNREQYGTRKRKINSLETFVKNVKTEANIH